MPRPRDLVGGAAAHRLQRGREPRQLGLERADALLAAARVTSPLLLQRLAAGGERGDARLQRLLLGQQVLARGSLGRERALQVGARRPATAARRRAW
ncbi:MAG: hypothetical protein U0802_00850 [Candidatus Binatia bacterium]